MTEYGPKTPLAIELDEMKYRLKGETFKEKCSRVANALKDSDEHYQAFREVLLDQRFLPGGRVQSAVGAPREVTPYNCFVSVTIEDSMDSIMDAAKKAAETMRLGGGIGYDFSNLRPNGANIVSLDSRASGPVSFMGIFDAICKTISSAGHRRGAQMGCLRIDHPDIEEFITCKSDNTTLTQFNISVLVTDEFMKAVDNDSMFQLRFDGRVYKQVRARYLWDKIMRQTWDYAEPGVLFIDRINRKNNLWYCETIAATNPCVSGDTPILTSRGYIPIGEVVGQTLHVWNGVEFSEVVPCKTGDNQKMVKVLLSDGSELRCTTAHKFIMQDGSRRNAEDLKAGDKLTKSAWPVIQSGIDADMDYYAQGFFSGDGWVKAETGAQYIGLYGVKRAIQHDWKEKSRHTYAVAGGYEGTDTDQDKEYLLFQRGTFQDKGFVPSEATLTSRKEWLAGLVDSDGCVTEDSCIQISAKDRDFLYRVKLMLNTMGVTGTLSAMKDCWRLSISGNHANILNLPTKRIRISPVSFSKARFPVVVSVEPAGIEAEVFCFTENQRHMGVFNGMLTGQCGEQPLPPHGACLLGSINLTKYIIWGEAVEPAIDYDQLLSDIPHIVRAMDNIVDRAIYPLPEQRESAISKRRMGIGLTGLANAGEALGFAYGSDGFITFQHLIMGFIRDHVYSASIGLAKEKGAFPLFDAGKYLQSEFAETLPPAIRKEIKKHGIRNSHLLSIAPTGTISNVADNVSGGIEPPFSLFYDRKVQTFEGEKTERVSDYAYREWGVAGRTALELSPAEHVKVLTVASHYVDSACSKTINIGDDVTWEDFQAVYRSAYDGGASGCTTFRSGGKRAGILEAAASEDVAEFVEGGACTIDFATGIRTCE